MPHQASAVSARRSVGPSNGARAEQPRSTQTEPSPMPRAEQVDRGEEPAHHGAQSLSRLHEPPGHRLLHQPLAMPGEQHRRVGRQLRQEARMPEEHDQVGAGRRVRQRVARGWRRSRTGPSTPAARRTPAPPATRRRSARSGSAPSA